MGLDAWVFGNFQSFRALMLIAENPRLPVLAMTNQNSVRKGSLTHRGVGIIPGQALSGSQDGLNNVEK